MSGTANFSELLATMKRLVEVMEREILLLRGSDTPELKDLQRDKIELASTYDSQVRILREDGQTLDPTWRQEFSSTAQTFRDTLLRNHQALNAAKATTDRVLQVIVREIEKQRSQQGGYSASGECGPSTDAKQPVSVAIDQRL